MHQSMGHLVQHFASEELMVFQNSVRPEEISRNYEQLYGSLRKLGDDHQELIGM